MICNIQYNVCLDLDTTDNINLLYSNVRQDIIYIIYVAMVWFIFNFYSDMHLTTNELPQPLMSSAFNMYTQD